jgi:hypothetical protein
MYILSLSPVFSGICVTRSLDLYVCFVDRWLSFCPFSFSIVLSVLLRLQSIIKQGLCDHCFSSELGFTDSKLAKRY